jgi:hypothetical protein
MNMNMANLLDMTVGVLSGGEVLHTPNQSRLKCLFHHFHPQL